MAITTKYNFLRFAELETCFTEQLMPEVLSSNNMTELTNNQGTNMTSDQSMNMTSFTNNLGTNLTNNQGMNMSSFTSNQGANLTSLVVMVPRVCPTALRKSHWYTRYDTMVSFFPVFSISTQ